MTSIQSMQVSPAILESLVADARLAPSPDNNQPWAFGLEETGIRVYHVRERALPSDVRDLFSWIGLGAAIENISLGASRHGLTAEIDYQSRPFPVDSYGEQIAFISFREGGETDPLSESIEDRVTNRRVYDRTPLSAGECQDLSNAVTLEACRVFWLTEKPKIRQFANLAAVADRIRFEHRPFHEEFHSVLRHTPAHAQQTGDGLDIKSLELPPLAGPLLRFLKPWNRMRLANRLGMSRAFANSAKKPIVGSGAIGLFVTSDASDEGYLEAGRMFQRMWLKAMQMGLAFQPLGALPLFLTKLAVEGPKVFQTSHAAALESIVAPFHDLFSNRDRSAPVMLFRIGYAPAPTARSIRYPLEQILMPHESEDDAN